jgi:hypothetical protein
VASIRSRRKLFDVSVFGQLRPDAGRGENLYMTDNPMSDDASGGHCGLSKPGLQ